MEFLKSLFEKGALTWEQFQQCALRGGRSAINKCVGVLQAIQLGICTDVTAVFSGEHEKTLSSLSH